MILNIRKIGDPILRSDTKKVDEISDKTKNLIDNMIETMYSHDGIGLAAPQVGVLKQVVVIDTGDKLLEIINPEIISTAGKEIGEEGCLSVPNRTGHVIRAKKAVVKALNRDGEQFKIDAKDLLARALQHEIDHLNGTLFVDKVVDPKDFDSIQK